jgi:hypothetical protein
MPFAVDGDRLFFLWWYRREAVASDPFSTVDKKYGGSLSLSFEREHLLLRQFEGCICLCALFSSASRVLRGMYKIVAFNVCEIYVNSLCHSLSVGTAKSQPEHEHFFFWFIPSQCDANFLFYFLLECINLFDINFKLQILRIEMSD